MSYFVTGATGFLGRFLVSKLLARKGTIHVLVRMGSERKLEAIAERMGWDRKRIVVVNGDLAKPKLGLTATQVRALSGKVMDCDMAHDSVRRPVQPTPEALPRSRGIS